MCLSLHSGAAAVGGPISWQEVSAGLGRGLLGTFLPAPRALRPVPSEPALSPFHSLVLSVVGSLCHTHTRSHSRSASVHPTTCPSPPRSGPLLLVLCFEWFEIILAK